MYIDEAIKEATETNWLVARKSVMELAPNHLVGIGKGAHGIYWLFAFENNGEKTRDARPWHPSAEDLMADDWVVITRSAPMILEKPLKRKRSWKCIFTKR